MAVITVSRLFGTGGVEFTKRLAHTLGYRHFSKEISEALAKKMGLPTKIIREYEECLYHTKNWIFSSFGGRITLTCQTSVQVEDYRRLITDIISNLAAEGNVVILGRGGQCILKNYPNTYHFRLVASIEDRLKHLIAEYKDPSILPTRKTLEYRIKWIDSVRAKFIKIHFKDKIDDPGLYHGIFNISKLGRENVLQLILKIVSGHICPTRKNSVSFSEMANQH
ncbi:cytidylate kinase-like family protein [candidate division KSB1 bacterium]|nr:cytidylate kinase-like family protein [candidate division KSB1 bacterium]